MVGTVEHLLHAVLVDRAIPSESWRLRVSLVGRRTNLVMDRFTVVSAVFPPGTCLVGV